MARTRHCYHSWHQDIKSKKERHEELVSRLRAQIEKAEREGRPTEGLRQMLEELTR